LVEYEFIFCDLCRGRYFLILLIIEPGYRRALFIQVSKGDASYGDVVDAKMQEDEDEQEGICRPWGGDKRNNDTTELK
jgi:hypothetical protein